ncbi:carboxymuconolactone decarboxylase family protein [Agaribacterium sp. ZY112]|uniref:carboxymuconolactone decarboxylase family protein n=1 Tax=Agaribacterium sp. ZY112 TaxID=3233574 RepID=UPI0035248C06
MSHFQQVTKDINSKLAEFQKRMPETMKGFGQMASVSKKDSALDAKTKELIATAIAIAARCEGCLGFHAKACVKLGVNREEFESMLEVAMYMGGGPSVMTAAEAMNAYEEFGGESL